VGILIFGTFLQRRRLVRNPALDRSGQGPGILALLLVKFSLSIPSSANNLRCHPSTMKRAPAKISNSSGKIASGESM
jgi:hypothetical protein